MNITVGIGFNLGQTVYKIGEEEPLIVDMIGVKSDKYGYNVEYRCGELWMKKHELTAKNPKLQTIYNLEIGDSYFTITNSGDVEEYMYTDTNRSDKVIESGNAFITEEEAANEAKRRKIHQELKKLACGYKYRKGKNNYCLYFSAEDNRIEVLGLMNMQFPNTAYFDTEEQAQKAIEEIGEEVLIRDYFGMEIQK